MFNRIRDGLEEGNRRYGSRQNSMVDWECPKCGNKATVSSVYDEKICMKDGCGTSMVKVGRDNADRDMGDYAACAGCGHQKGLHIEGGSKCYTCGCTEFKNNLKNQDGISKRERDLALGKPIPSRSGDDAIENADPHAYNPIGPNGECVECGKKEIDHQALENANWEDKPCPSCGHKCDDHYAGDKSEIYCHASGCSCKERCRPWKAGELDNDGGKCRCGHSHDGDVCDDCDCTIFSRRENGAMVPTEYKCETCGKEFYTPELFTAHKKIKHGIENDVTLGYDYGTSTTMVPAGSECKECGHTIGQSFYDLNCHCRCHAEMANTVCDICRREEGAGLEEHLVTKHGLDSDVATVVAADMESVRG